MPLLFVSLFFIGLASSFLGGLLGIGGGIILVPAMMILLDIPYGQAIGLSLITIVITSFSATWKNLENDRIDYHKASILELGTIGGVIIAGILASRVSLDILDQLYGYFLFFIAILFLLAKKIPQRKSKTTSTPLGLFLGSFAGLLSFFLGIGSGVILVPTLRWTMGLSIHRATATSAWVVGTTAALAGLIHYMRLPFNWTMILPLIIGALIGGVAGSSVGHKSTPKVLNTLFSFFVMIVAIRMMMR